MAYDASAAGCYRSPVCAAGQHEGARARGRPVHRTATTDTATAVLVQEGNRTAGQAVWSPCAVPCTATVLRLLTPPVLLPLPHTLVRPRSPTGLPAMINVDDYIFLSPENCCTRSRASAGMPAPSVDAVPLSPAARAPHPAHLPHAAPAVRARDEVRQCRTPHGVVHAHAVVHRGHLGAGWRSGGGRRRTVRQSRRLQRPTAPVGGCAGPHHGAAVQF